MSIQSQTATYNLPKPDASALRASHDPLQTLIIDIRGDDGRAKKEVYNWGPLLGKGAYAACHEVAEISTGNIYACKIFPRSKLSSETSKNRFLTEIQIHRSLNHQHIVRYQAVGSNSDNYYVLLEKCNNKSLRQVVKARVRLSEDEVRYWMSQLLSALNYLHANCICHRDLKLDNVFLHNMQVKLGDFGFSVKLQPDEKTRTFCGTPNYIAPEVVARTPYSLPVDIWAFGVLIYTMLYGTPPFETTSAETTYAKIASNDYSFPEDIIVSEEAKDVIRRCLKHVPSERPTTAELLQHEFFDPSRTPLSLSPSALGYRDHQFGIVTGSAKKRARDIMLPTTATDTLAAPVAKRLTVEYNKENTGNVGRTRSKATASRAAANPNAENADEDIHNQNDEAANFQATPQRRTPATRRGTPVSGTATTSRTTIPIATATANATTTTTTATSNAKPHVAPARVSSSPWNHQRHVDTINRIVNRLREIASVPAVKSVPTNPPPSVTPHEAHQLGHHWIVKWVDYSQRFGLGFQYCDDTVGVLFTDKTSLLNKPHSTSVAYTKFVEGNSFVPSAAMATTSSKQVPSSEAKRQLNYVVEEFDTEADKEAIQAREQIKNRMKLLAYFSDYMKTRLVPSSGLAMVCDSPAEPSGPAPIGVFKWIKTTSAIGFLFTNYTVQINFYDHVKLVITLQDPENNPNAVELITVVNDKGTSSTRSAQQLMDGGLMTSALISKLEFAATLISTEFVTHP